MAGFQIQFEAIDQASPTIQKLSKEMIEAAKKSDKFASEIVNSTRRVDTSLKKIPPAAKQAKDSMSSLSNASGELKTALTGLVSTAAISAFFKQAVGAALEEEEALRRLAFAVEATGNSFSDNKDRLLEFANSRQALSRFDDTATFETLGRILRVTGDVGQAMQGAALSQDIAAASGKELGFVTEQVAQLLAGETRALLILKKEFGAFVGNARTTQEALNGLQQGFSGAAADEESFTKSLAHSTNFLGDFSQKVGEGVLPVLNFLARTVAFIAKGFEELGETIGFVMAEALVNIQGAVKAGIALLKGNIGEAKRIVAETGKQSKGIAEDFAEGINEIEERFSKKRKERLEDEARLKSKQSVQDIDRAQKEAEAREQAARKAKDTIIRLEAERLEADGQNLESRRILINLEKEERIRQLEELREKGLITEQELLDAKINAAAIASQHLEKAKQDQLNNLDEMGKAAKQVSDAMVSAWSKGVADMVLEGKRFEDVFDSVMKTVLRTAIETFTRVAIEAAIAQKAAQGVSGVAGGIAGGIGVGLFAAAAPKVLKAIKFAEGGIVRRPTVGLVGEAGPEAIVPLNKAGSFGNVQVIVNQTNNISVNGSTSDQTREIMRKISEVTRSGASEGAELVKSILSKSGRFQREAV